MFFNFCGKPVISCFRYFVQEVSNFVDSEDIVGLHNVHGTVHLLGSLTKCEYYHMGLDARKPVVRGFANNLGADQPVHPRRLISAFVTCFSESIII